MSGSGAIRGWMLVGLVPAMFAIDMWVPRAEGLPTGIGEALGCSGAGNVPLQEGWTLLRPWLPTDAEHPNVPVATDGFFVIRAGGNGLSLEEATAQLRVVVNDAGGSDVAGDVALLRNESESDGSYLFGWVARQPLEVGTTLNATLATEPASTVNTGVGGPFVLEVVGAPTPLPAPEATFEGWSKFYHGTGDTVQCTLRNSCLTSSQDVPREVVEQVAAVLRWTPPQINGGVAWNVRVELGPADVDNTEHAQTFLGSPGVDVTIPRLAFPQQSIRYCVTLVLEDLRSGQDRRANLCSAPVAPLTEVDTDTRLQDCSEPPTSELTRAWCELTQANVPACAASPTQEPTQEPEPVTQVTRGPDLGDDSSPPPDGCQLGATRSAAPALAALGGLVLAALRRRTRRCSKTPAR